MSNIELYNGDCLEIMNNLIESKTSLSDQDKADLITLMCQLNINESDLIIK